MPQARIELATFRSLEINVDYETDALPTALSRHLKKYNLCY